MKKKRHTQRTIKKLANSSMKLVTIICHNWKKRKITCLTDIITDGVQCTPLPSCFKGNVTTWHQVYLPREEVEGVQRSFRVPVFCSLCIATSIPKKMVFSHSCMHPHPLQVTDFYMSAISATLCQILDGKVQCSRIKNSWDGWCFSLTLPRIVRERYRRKFNDTKAVRSAWGKQRGAWRVTMTTKGRRNTHNRQVYPKPIESRPVIFKNSGSWSQPGGRNDVRN